MRTDGLPESTNVEDRSATPWYAPSKLLADVIIGLQRATGNQKQRTLDNVQRQRDANPIAPTSVAQEKQTKVRRTPDGSFIQRPGAAFEEYVPGYGDSNLPSKHVLDAGTMDILHSAGLLKKK